MIRRQYGSASGRRSIREFWDMQARGASAEEMLDPSSKAGGLEKGLSSVIAEQKRLFVGKVLFQFSTEGLSKSDRVRFFYGLKGRGSNRGIIDDCNGVHLGPGVVLLPRRHAPAMEDFLVDFNADFHIQDIWVLQPSRKSQIRKAFERKSVR